MVLLFRGYCKGGKVKLIDTKGFRIYLFVNSSQELSLLLSFQFYLSIIYNYRNLLSKDGISSRSPYSF